MTAKEKKPVKIDPEEFQYNYGYAEEHPGIYFDTEGNMIASLRSAWQRALIKTDKDGNTALIDGWGDGKLRKAACLKFRGSAVLDASGLGDPTKDE